MALSMEPVRREGKSGYWAGFAAGAFIGTGAAIAAVYLANLNPGRDSHILRLEDSVQIGRPVAEVFRAWADLEQLPRYLEFVNSVRVEGNTSYWDATVDSKNYKWQAQTIQLIPNESIGWKSVTGPKHSGRITFSPIGNDTLVHVTMNYAPPLGRFGRMLSPVADHLDGYISKALRDFKHALEGKGETRASTSGSSRREQQATGTAGPGPIHSGPVGDAEDTSERVRVR